MKILPIINTYNKQQFRQSFKGMADESYSGFADYITTDTYVDETGMHYLRSNIKQPMIGVNEDIYIKPQMRTAQALKERIFLSQEQFEERDFDDEFYLRKDKNSIQKALYDMDLEKVDEYVKNLEENKRIKILRQPFFALGLADIPLTEQNKELYQDLLTRTVERTNGTTVNVIDNNGITLLEKVMNSENEPYLKTIKEICKKGGDSIYPSSIAYDRMQKYAFDNIQNPKFKEQCKNLPIKFYDIVEDIKRKDLISFDKHIQEQMKCGFCDIDYALYKSIFQPIEEMKFSTRMKLVDYTLMVIDVLKKHFPNEINSSIKGSIINNSMLQRLYRYI